MKSSLIFIIALIIAIMQIYTREGKETHEKIHVQNKKIQERFQLHSKFNPKVTKIYNTEELTQF